MHRFSGLPGNLFRTWSGTWDQISPWPPGTMYAQADAGDGLLGATRPEGWRVVIRGNRGLKELSLEILDLPSLENRDADLPEMIRSWIEELAPRTRVSQPALEKLVRMARDCGFEELEGVLKVALATAGELLEEEHLPIDGYHTAFVDELLQAPKPLAALEERLLREVLERSGWKMQDAADKIGISRVTLWRKMKDLGIEKGS
jgi:DNA-binding NtrC family response regulator